MVCGRLARVLNENTFAVRLVGIRSDLGAVSPKEGSLFDTPKGCLAWAGDAWPRIGVGPQYRSYRQRIGLGGGEGSMGKSLSRPATSRSHTTYAIMSSMNAKAATRRWLHPTPAWLVWGAVALCADQWPSPQSCGQPACATDGSGRAEGEGVAGRP